MADKELEQQLAEAGNKLLTTPPTVDELLLLLDQIENCLIKVDQSPTKSMQKALAPSLNALVADQLFKHSDVDVKVAVACCISEITRITAPEAPYDDDRMKDVFQLIVSSFENLFDKSSRSYGKRTAILETVAKVRSCVVMLDLECDALIIEMFQHFLSAIRDYHSDSVFASMETIMVLVLEESEDISAELLSPLLATLKKGNKEILPIARKLAEKVLETCANKVKPYLQRAVKSSAVSLDDYSEVVASICQESSGSVEQNVALTADENKVEDNKPVEASPDEAAQADTEVVAEAGLPKPAEPTNDKSPKLVASNGVAQTCEDESVVDSCSLKKQDDSTHADSSKNVDSSTDADPKSLDAEKLVNDETNPEDASKNEGRKGNSSTKSAEPSESSNIDAEKDEPKPIDDNTAGKNIPSSPDAETAAENKKEACPSQPSSPMALEAKPVAVDSPSESENLPKAVRPKKVKSIRDCEPSVNDVSRKTLEGISDSEAKPNKRSKKEISTKDSEPSVVDDVARKTYEGTSDSEVKLNKTSSKTAPGKISDKGKTSKTDASNKETTCDSETKSLKKPSKKVDVSSNNGDGLSVVKNKKQQSHGKSLSEKNVSGGSTKVNDKVSSPKSAAKSTKNVHHLETPKTDNKRKRPSGNDKGSKNGGDYWVGKRVKVYWPYDRKYYRGSIDSYHPSIKKHEILYDDGDIEILYLKEEIWAFIDDDVDDDDDMLDKAEADAPKSPGVHPETPQKKKPKKIADQSPKQGTVESAKGGGATSSKPKTASAKSAQKPKDSAKTMNDSKAAKETEGNTNKSGKSRTPKPSNQETPKTGKSSTPNIASIKSSGKSSVNNGAGKLKSSLPKVKETVDDNYSADSDEPLEITKAKSKAQNSSKGQAKSGNKRQRV